MDRTIVPAASAPNLPPNAGTVSYSAVATANAMMSPVADTIGIIIHTNGLNLRSIMPVRSWKIGQATIATTTARIATNENQFISSKRIEGERGAIAGQQHQR